ncbi:MAG: hemerythrin domain-containing protein [Lacisediminihabitans sp.]
MSDDWEPGPRSLDHRRITVVSRGIESLIASLPVTTGRARRRQVLKAKGVRILRLSLDAGQVLAERAESSPLLIQTLQGRVTLTVDGERVDMPAGAIIHLDRLLPHSIAAVDASHVMVTLLGPRLAKLHTAAVSPTGPAEQPRSQLWAQQNSVLAATGANAVAFDEITRCHGEFLRELAARTTALLDRLAGDAEFSDLVDELAGWVRAEVLPHLRREAKVFYPVVALRPQQRVLVSALEDELVRIAGAVDRLAQTDSGAKFDTASAAIALRVIISRHLSTEAEVLLPTLAVSTDESLATLWARVNENLGVSLGV